jgi:hypothetical protein
MFFCAASDDRFLNPLSESSTASHTEMQRLPVHGRDGSDGEAYMKAKTLTVALALAALASAGPALADDNGTAEEQRDCRRDAMTHCSQHIFAPDRNARIAACLWQRRAQISKVCASHLRAPKR